MSDRKKIKLFMAIPTTGTIATHQEHIRRQLHETYKDEIEFVYPKNCVFRIFHDHARNALVKEFLEETDCDILWFLDSDISPPDNVLDIITKYHKEWKLAGAPYPVFMTPPGEAGPQVLFTVYKGRSDKGLHAASIPADGTDWVDGIATGCLFIKREIFEELQEPYFEFIYDEKTRNILQGEDLNFCTKVGKMGHKFFVDYSKVCRHFKNVCLLEVNNYALDFAHKSVMEYDRRIRATIGALGDAKKAVVKQPQSKLILPKSLSVR